MCDMLLCKLCCCTCYTHYCVDCSLSLYCVQSLIPSWVLFHVMCSMLLCILLCTSRCCNPHCDVVAHVHVAMSTIAHHYIACNPSCYIGHFSHVLPSLNPLSWMTWCLGPYVCWIVKVRHGRSQAKWCYEVASKMT